ncbi:DUF3422 domain-containing protein [Rhizobiales bacterium]|uniref:DUF3422 family protein n=1 Tax=Hongsoonwoonella zoysiae TaxID=2821844 RepID=UPI001561360F|nr:DUF3422 domain-containing protein [Hongsoonwoonella zoysiae]
MTEKDKEEARSGGLPAFEAHPFRDLVLGEVHARPFRLAETPRVFLRYGFTTDEQATARDREWFSGFCRSNGAPVPDVSARYHVIDLQTGTLRWERHGEFTTYTWDGPGQGAKGVFEPPPGHPFGAGFRAPGPLIVAARLDLVRVEDTEFEPLIDRFDRASLAVSGIHGNAARIVSDFRQDKDGMTRILVVDHRLRPHQAGALAQRLLEVETYRTLALLGLAEANRQAPNVARIEAGLADIAEKMRSSEGVETNRVLLDDLTRLAADLEAGAAASAYRFGASRAYEAIVRERLLAIEEGPVEGYFTFNQFLNRRMAPAMRTCRTLEERQVNLSRKLARAATLLRTRVDVELERQNRDLLVAMNRRARLQLRLQQTVEGLSVAAVSYYVVGLISYLAKASKAGGLPLPASEVVTGLSVPLVVIAIWMTVRRIRKRHADPEKDEAP